MSQSPSDDWLPTGTPIKPTACDCGSVLLHAVGDQCRECDCWVCGHSHVHGGGEPSCPDAGLIPTAGVEGGLMSETLKILALDSGAERMGWAVLEGVYGRKRVKPKWIDSGIWSFPRGDKKFQDYKLELIENTARQIRSSLKWHTPDYVVAEIVPAVGGGNFVAATQSHLAHTAVTVAQGIAVYLSIPIYQIGATTVKNKIGGKGDASKVRVRNGVYQFFPFLKESRGELWKKIHDESDAIGVGLAHFGYDINSI